MDYKENIKKLIEGFLNSLDIHEDVVIERPKEKENGDFSTNIAMKLTKVLNKKPLEIAEMIKDGLKKDFEKIEIAGPGFINFFLKNEERFDIIEQILNEKDDYGRSKVGKGEKINVEFVSANPTGTLHVGTARGAAYGDNICRILDYAGFDVTREYYINDAGNQIYNLGLSIKTRYENLCGITSEMPKEGYFGKEIIDIASSIYNEYKNEKVKEGIDFFKEIGKNKLLEQIKIDLENFRVAFDIWSSETDIRNSGKIEECLKMLKDMDNIYEKDSALWLKTTKYGDDKDRVIVKSDKEYTYLVPDIAYHLDKINRGYDKLIDVLGSDHHGYVSRLRASIEALGYDKEKLEIKLLQMVKLIRDQKEVKMSKRTGETVTITELIDEVGIDAARYFFAMRSLDTQMDFDITLATKKTNENPVYYVQYAHARICSILRETIKRENIDKYSTIESDYAYNLLNKISEFKDVVEASASKQLPHLITNYLYDLATTFHSFYAHEKILSDDIKYTSERLNLIECAKITIKNALNLIGVEALERM